MVKNTLKVTTPSDCEIVMTRAFDAPCRLVWEAMTKPELIRRWLYFPDDWKMTMCKEDPRVGGGFRWEWAGPDGKTAMVMHGVYREVVPPGNHGTMGRMVRTETMEFGSIGGEALATIELNERTIGGGRTTNLTLTMLFASREARDGAIASGMEHGVAVGYDKLEEMLASAAVSA